MPTRISMWENGGMGRFLLALRRKLWAIIITPFLGFIPWAGKSLLSDSFVKRFDAIVGRAEVTDGIMAILETMSKYPISSCIGLATTVLIVCAVYSAIEAKRRPQMIDRKESKANEKERPIEGPILPTSEIRTVKQWSDAANNLKQISKHNFSYEEVKLDGNYYIDCSFTHVNLLYDGTAPVGVRDCKFDADTVSHLHTHHPALAQWMSILGTLGMLKSEPGLMLHPRGSQPIPLVNLADKEEGRDDSEIERLRKECGEAKQDAAQLRVENDRLNQHRIDLMGSQIVDLKGKSAQATAEPPTVEPKVTLTILDGVVAEIPSQSSSIALRPDLQILLHVSVFNGRPPKTELYDWQLKVTADHSVCPQFVPGSGSPIFKRLLRRPATLMLTDPKPQRVEKWLDIETQAAIGPGLGKEGWLMFHISSIAVHYAFGFKFRLSVCAEHGEQCSVDIEPGTWLEAVEIDWDNQSQSQAAINPHA